MNTIQCRGDNADLYVGELHLLPSDIYALGLDPAGRRKLQVRALADLQPIVADRLRSFGPQYVALQPRFKHSRIPRRLEDGIKVSWLVLADQRSAFTTILKDREFQAQLRDDLHLEMGRIERKVPKGPDIRIGSLGELILQLGWSAFSSVEYPLWR